MRHRHIGGHLVVEHGSLGAHAGGADGGDADRRGGGFQNGTASELHVVSMILLGAA